MLQKDMNESISDQEINEGEVENDGEGNTEAE